MKVAVEVYPEYHLVKAQGKITIGSGDLHLRYTMVELVRSGAKRIILDLSKVSYIDSSGLGELINIYKEVRSRHIDLCLVGLNKKLYSILGLAQLVSLFPIFDSVEDAAMMGALTA